MLRRIASIIGCLMAIFILAPGVASAPPDQTPDLPALIEEIHAEVQPNQAMEFMRRVYSTDRWFTFPNFQETADYLKQTMQNIGLQDVDVVSAPADGVTQVGGSWRNTARFA